jgi:anaerobic nitric oxide reductase transcription regulator
VRLDSPAVAGLRSYPWPGNVRELENLILRATLKAAAGHARGAPIVLGLAHLGLDFAATTVPTTDAPRQAARGDRETIDLRDATRDFQRSLIRRALEESGDNWAAAARSLGMHRSNFHHLASRLGLR